MLKETKELKQINKRFLRKPKKQKIKKYERKQKKI